MRCTVADHHRLGNRVTRLRSHISRPVADIGRRGVMAVALVESCLSLFFFYLPMNQESANQGYRSSQHSFHLSLSSDLRSEAANGGASLDDQLNARPYQKFESGG